MIAANLPNLTGSLDRVDHDAAQNEVIEWIDDLSIKVADPELPVKTLSGGNQQRVVLGKWLATKPSVLILNGPTVGVDIGSKHDIHEALKQLAKTGLSIIIISDDIPEILSVCNRILIMRDGKMVEELKPSETNVAELSVKIATDTQEKVS